MLDTLDEAVSARRPQNSAAVEIKVEPGDAVHPVTRPKDNEKVSTPKRISIFGRFLRFGTQVAAIAFLCAVAWAVGAYYPHGDLPFEFFKPGQASNVQQNSQPDEIVRAMAQMAEDMRTLKASVAAGTAMKNTGAENANSQDGVTKALDAQQTRTEAAIADLANRVDKLEADSTAKLSQIGEQLVNIEHQLTSSHVAQAAPGQTPHKRIEHHHDAFDPTKDPTAPGVPRPLVAR